MCSYISHYVQWTFFIAPWSFFFPFFFFFSLLLIIFRCSYASCICSMLIFETSLNPLFPSLRCFDTFADSFIKFGLQVCGTFFWNLVYIVNIPYSITSISHIHNPSHELHKITPPPRISSYIASFLFYILVYTFLLYVNFFDVSSRYYFCYLLFYSRSFF